MKRNIGIFMLMLFVGVLMSTTVLAQGKGFGLDVKDANIRDVIQMVFKASGKGVVIGPEVQGTITITLPEMPWEQALGYILDQSGAQFKKDSNGIYNISPKPKVNDNSAQNTTGPSVPRGGANLEGPSLPRQPNRPTEKTVAGAAAEEEKIYEKIPMTYVYAGDIAIMFGGTIIALSEPGSRSGGGSSGSSGRSGSVGGNSGGGGRGGNSGRGNNGGSGFGGGNSNGNRNGR